MNAGLANGHPAPPAAIQGGDRSAAEPGALLSPSQANCFLECPAKWYFRYLLELPDPPNAARALGTCVHSAIEAHMVAKFDGHPLTPAETIAEYVSAWQAMFPLIEWSEEDKPGELAELGALLVAVWLRDAAPGIEPAAIERPVHGEIGGVSVRGFIDLLDTEGRVIDTKTASKKPHGVQADYRLQVTTYAMLEPKASGAARLVTLTKTKTVACVEQSFEVTGADRRYAESIYPLVQDGVRSGIYPPRRNSFLCSRKYCGYWRQCEREFGGEVSS